MTDPVLLIDKIIELITIISYYRLYGNGFIEFGKYCDKEIKIRLLGFTNIEIYYKNVYLDIYYRNNVISAIYYKCRDLKNHDDYRILMQLSSKKFGYLVDINILCDVYHALNHLVEQTEFNYRQI